VNTQRRSIETATGAQVDKTAISKFRIVMKVERPQGTKVMMKIM
jgi:hypothetical protein